MLEHFRSRHTQCVPKETGRIFLLACDNLMVSIYKSSTGEPIYRLKLEEQHEAQPRDHSWLDTMVGLMDPRLYLVSPGPCECGIVTGRHHGAASGC